MKCSIQGCPGRYEQKEIIHTVRQGGQIRVLEHVPAEVCNICGDTILSPRTIRRIDALLKSKRQPQKVVPLYDYA